MKKKVRVVLVLAMCFVMYKLMFLADNYSAETSSLIEPLLWFAGFWALYGVHHHIGVLLRAEQRREERRREWYGAH